MKNGGSSPAPCPSPPAEGGLAAGSDYRDRSVSAGTVCEAGRSKLRIEFDLFFVAAQLTRSGPGEGKGKFRAEQKGDANVEFPKKLEGKDQERWKDSFLGG